MYHWYVIYTKQRKEQDVEVYLTTRGVEIFNPLIEIFSLRSRKGRELKPLFPSYLFGKFDLEKNYCLVRWAKGVRQILGSGGYPIPISCEVVDLIKKRAGSDGIVRRTSTFKPDDRVRIISGPLKDLLGIFENYVSDGERVRVLLNLIGYHPSVELHYSIVEKIA